MNESAVAPTGIDTIRLFGTTLVTVDSLIKWVERAMAIDSGPEGNAIKQELLDALRMMR